MNHTGITAAAALLLFAALPAQPPDAEPPLLERAQQAQQAKDYSAAADLFLELVESEPQEKRWVLEATDCLLRAERFNDSLDVLDGAMSRFPESADIPTRIARTHHLLAENMVARGIRDMTVRFQLAEAARVADAVLQDHPAEREPRLILALASIKLGELEQALAEAEEIVRRFPSEQAGYVILGDVHYQEFVQLRTREMSEQLSGTERKDLLDLTKAARDSATAAYERAASLDESRAYPHVQLGNIYGWIPNIEQALREYETALSLDARCAVNHTWVEQRTPPERRIELYQKAAASYREKAGFDAAAAAILDWYHAYALYQAKKFGEAYELFSSTVEANAAYLNSRCYAMLSAYWNGKHDDAEEQAARYAAEAPKNFADTVRGEPQKSEIIAVLEFLVRRTHEAGRVERCRSISHVLAMLLDTERHWNNYAFLCRQTGEFEASLVGYETALGIAPDSPQVLNDAAVILQYHLPTPENLQRARSYYRRAITESDKILKDAAASNDDISRARQAKKDATANLGKLPKD